MEAVLKQHVLLKQHKIVMKSIIILPCNLFSVLIVPSTPHDVVFVSTRTSILFSWSPPVTPNGLITVYDFSVTPGRVLQPISPLLNRLLCDLSPGTKVTAAITASTIAGQGPPVTVQATTTATRGV